MALDSRAVGRSALGTGLGEVPLRSLASLGLVRASQAEKAINQGVNWEASPLKAGHEGDRVSMAVTGEVHKQRRRRTG